MTLVRTGYGARIAEAPRSPLDLDVLLAAVDAAPPVDAAAVLAQALAETLDAEDVSFLIADFSGDTLLRLSHVRRRDGQRGSLDRERTEEVALEGTPHGRAVTGQEIVLEPEDGGTRVFAPVSSRGEAVGVLELWLPERPDEDALRTLSGAARALAYVLIANRRFTDLFEWGQRSRPLSLEAEIQHRLLPGSYTCEAGPFTLAGWLEPAGEVGGDTFDYSLERDTLHLSMTDAMGHTLDAALLATVLVGSLRNARRRGVGLSEQAQEAHAALTKQFGDGSFVTGQIVRIHLPSATACIVNAGHPLPIRVRDGVAAKVELHPDPPFAVPMEVDFQVQEIDLAPGDRLVFLTDGMLERNASTVDVLGVLAATRHLHPREAVQELTKAVVHACGGELKDDATVMCVDWHGPTAAGG